MNKDEKSPTNQPRDVEVEDITLKEMENSFEDIRRIDERKIHEALQEEMIDLGFTQDNPDEDEIESSKLIFSDEKISALTRADMKTIRFDWHTRLLREFIKEEIFAMWEEEVKEIPLFDKSNNDEKMRFIASEYGIAAERSIREYFDLFKIINTEFTDKELNKSPDIFNTNLQYIADVSLASYVKEREFEKMEKYEPYVDAMKMSDTRWRFLPLVFSLSRYRAPEYVQRYRSVMKEYREIYVLAKRIAAMRGNSMLAPLESSSDPFPMLPLNDNKFSELKTLFETFQDNNNYMGLLQIKAILTKRVLPASLYSQWIKRFSKYYEELKISDLIEGDYLLPKERVLNVSDSLQKLLTILEVLSILRVSKTKTGEARLERSEQFDSLMRQFKEILQNGDYKNEWPINKENFCSSQYHLMQALASKSASVPSRMISYQKLKEELTQKYGSTDKELLDKNWIFQVTPSRDKKKIFDTVEESFEDMVQYAINKTKDLDLQEILEEALKQSSREGFFLSEQEMDLFKEISECQLALKKIEGKSDIRMQNVEEVSKKIELLKKKKKLTRNRRKVEMKNRALLERIAKEGPGRRAFIRNYEKSVPVDSRDQEYYDLLEKNRKYTGKTYGLDFNCDYIEEFLNECSMMTTDVRDYHVSENFTQIYRHQLRETLRELTSTKLFEICIKMESIYREIAYNSHRASSAGCFRVSVDSESNSVVIVAPGQSIRETKTEPVWIRILTRNPHISPVFKKDRKYVDFMQDNEFNDSGWFSVTKHHLDSTVCLTNSLAMLYLTLRETEDQKTAMAISSHFTLSLLTFRKNEGELLKGLKNMNMQLHSVSGDLSSGISKMPKELTNPSSVFFLKRFLNGLSDFYSPKETNSVEEEEADFENKFSSYMSGRTSLLGFIAETYAFFSVNKEVGHNANISELDVLKKLYKKEFKISGRPFWALDAHYNLESNSLSLREMTYACAVNMLEVFNLSSFASEEGLINLHNIRRGISSVINSDMSEHASFKTSKEPSWYDFNTDNCYNDIPQAEQKLKAADAKKNVKMSEKEKKIKTTETRLSLSQVERRYQMQQLILKNIKGSDPKKIKELSSKFKADYEADREKAIKDKKSVVEKLMEESKISRAAAEEALLKISENEEKQEKRTNKKRVPAYLPRDQLVRVYQKEHNFKRWTNRVMRQIMSRKDKVISNVLDYVKQSGHHTFIDFLNDCIKEIKESEEETIPYCPCLFFEKQQVGTREITEYEMKLMLLNRLAEKIFNAINEELPNEFTSKGSRKDIYFTDMCSSAKDSLKLNGDKETWCQNFPAYCPFLVLYLNLGVCDVSSAAYYQYLMASNRYYELSPYQIVSWAVQPTWKIDDKDISAIRDRCIGEKEGFVKTIVSIKAGFPQGLMQSASSFFHALFMLFLERKMNEISRVSVIQKNSLSLYQAFQIDLKTMLTSDDYFATLNISSVEENMKYQAYGLFFSIFETMCSDTSMYDSLAKRLISWNLAEFNQVILYSKRLVTTVFKDSPRMVEPFRSTSISGMVDEMYSRAKSLLQRGASFYLGACCIFLQQDYLKRFVLNGLNINTRWSDTGYAHEDKLDFTLIFGPKAGDLVEMMDIFGEKDLNRDSLLSKIDEMRVDDKKVSEYFYNIEGTTRIKAQLAVESDNDHLFRRMNAFNDKKISQYSYDSLMVYAALNRNPFSDLDEEGNFQRSTVIRIATRPSRLLDLFRKRNDVNHAEVREKIASKPLFFLCQDVESSILTIQAKLLNPDVINSISQQSNTGCFLRTALNRGNFIRIEGTEGLQTFEMVEEFLKAMAYSVSIDDLKESVNFAFYSTADIEVISEFLKIHDKEKAILMKRNQNQIKKAYALNKRENSLFEGLIMRQFFDRWTKDKLQDSEKMIISTMSNFIPIEANLEETKKAFPSPSDNDFANFLRNFYLKLIGLKKVSMTVFGFRPQNSKSAAEALSKWSDKNYSERYYFSRELRKTDDTKVSKIALNIASACTLIHAIRHKEKERLGDKFKSLPIDRMSISDKIRFFTENSKLERAPLGRTTLSNLLGTKQSLESLNLSDQWLISIALFKQRKFNYNDAELLYVTRESGVTTRLCIQYQGRLCFFFRTHSEYIIESDIPRTILERLICKYLKQKDFLDTRGRFLRLRKDDLMDVTEMSDLRILFKPKGYMEPIRRKILFGDQFTIKYIQARDLDILDFPKLESVNIGNMHLVAGSDVSIFYDHEERLFRAGLLRDDNLSVMMSWKLRFDNVEDETYVLNYDFQLGGLSFQYQINNGLLGQPLRKPDFLPSRELFDMRKVVYQSLGIRYYPSDYELKKDIRSITHANMSKEEIKDLRTEDEKMQEAINSFSDYLAKTLGVDESGNIIEENKQLSVQGATKIPSLKAKVSRYNRETSIINSILPEKLLRQMSMVKNAYDINVDTGDIRFSFGLKKVARILFSMFSPMGKEETKWLLYPILVKLRMSSWISNTDAALLDFWISSLNFLYKDYDKFPSQKSSASQIRQIVLKLQGFSKDTKFLESTELFDYIVDEPEASIMIERIKEEEFDQQDNFNIDDEDNAYSSE